MNNSRNQELIFNYQMRQTLEHQNLKNHIRGCESDEEAAASKKRRDCTQLGNLQSIYQQQEGSSINVGVSRGRRGGGYPQAGT